MSDSSSADFLGRYILFMVLCSEGEQPKLGGWFTVGAGGSLAFADQLLPFDNSALFDFYTGPSSSVFIQSVATGQYLAAHGSDNALFVSAATIAQAEQFYIGDGNWGVSEFSTALYQATGNPFDSLVACGSTVPDSALGLVLNPAPDAATTIGMLCVTPGTAATSRRALPPDLAAKLANVAPPRRMNATARANWHALMEPRSRPPAMRAADGTPPLPYFAGKYAFGFGFGYGLPGGWVVPTGGDTVPISATLPTDGSALCNLYMQPPINGGIFGELPAVSVQTTRGFLRMPTGSLLGPLGLDANVKSVASAAAFGLNPAFGNFVTMMLWPNPGGPVISVTCNSNNTVCTVNSLSSEPALLTRVVPGLQDILAPGAKNWWDGADLRYVDMTTCVGSLTGAAAQWGNANFTAAIFTKMDLTAVIIGNAVNFTNAVLAGVKFKSGQDLSQATLSGADLSGADLSGVDLSGAACVGTNFTNTDLRTTKLPTATGLLGQGSTGAIFAGATVPLASLGSDWRNLDLSATKLLPLSLLLPLPLSPPVTVTALRADNAKFQKTILDGLTLAADANGHAASFQSADLTNASLQGIAAESANFSSAVLYAADLTNADLTSTTWSNAFAGSKQLLFTLSPFATSDLTTLNNGSVPADLSSAFAANGHPLQSPQVKVRSDSSAWLITDGNNVYSVIRAVNALDVLTTGRTSAQFSGATLANANLTGGSFAGVHFKGVQLTGAANASGVDFEQADFSNANISSGTSNQPNLQGAYLYGANLDDAFMFNANLAGAYLSPSTSSAPATLSGAMLANATLTGANLEGTVMTGAFIGLQPQGAPSGFSGVPLFTLDAATFAPILNNGANWGTAAPAALQTAFANNGIALSGPAIFTAYPGQAQWGISLTDANLDPPPTPAAAGWVWTMFMIMQGNPQYQGTSDLVVYGTMLWMFAPDLTGALQPLPYAVSVATAISQNDVVATTYCPNSRTWATNLANGVPWEAVMMPASQPVSGTQPGAPPLQAQPLARS
jgi:uncharacterized protein YjbI with pentapeptide repeats